MLILGLDMARCTGWAMGEAGAIPASGSWELGPKGVPVFSFPGRLTDELSAIVAKRGRPDLVAVEAFMSPSWSRNDKATISQLLLHGALLAWCHASGIKLVWEQASTIRLNVCGRGKAQGEDIKDMVLRSAKLLSLIPADCTDHNQADAAIVFAWAEAAHARHRRMVLA